MKKITLAAIIATAFFFSILSTTASYAQPYGKGKYNAIVPYGNQTSLSIATSGNITIPITPTDSGATGTANSTVTISSTDVMGYKLYIRALNRTDMDNLGTYLPSRALGTGTLPVNTWGYNIAGSTTDFDGISLSDTLIKSIATPAPNDITTFTYGLKVDMAKPAGRYTVDILYTAVPQTD